MVVPGVGPASNRAVIELGRKFRGIIFPALGFHPERFLNIAKMTLAKCSK